MHTFGKSSLPIGKLPVGKFSGWQDMPGNEIVFPCRASVVFYFVDTVHKSNNY
jgi:hypothetical protein